MNNFGDRVRAAMLVLGLDPTAAVLAKRCTVSRQTAKKWLSMRTAALQGGSLLKLSSCLNARMHWLVSGEGPMVWPDDMEAAFSILTRLPQTKIKRWLKIGSQMIDAE